MASIKDVKYKVTAIKKTKQITRAMNMVSSAKLRSAQRRVEYFMPYRERYSAILSSILSSQTSYTHPLLEEVEGCSTVCIVLVTPDRGLCGAFTANILQQVVRRTRELEAQGFTVVYYCIGKKGYEFIQKIGKTCIGQHVGCMSVMNFALAVEMVTEIQTLFLEQHVKAVHIVYGHFASLMTQEPVCTQLLPLVLPKPQGIVQEALYEPSSTILLEELIPAFVRIVLYGAIIDTIVSEHAARMLAMDSATKNCNDLIESLSLLYNKTRQAAVTRELMDIVGGAEALNG